ncbi:hypothetical protein M427DRAFT_61959 [Gonapodya prolifera JEL478]|uniref:Amidohydrolase-related domain-containing protein n=1 Tax=Gonapodya prolifera (strain JEL478) TaxID=1344416 RepID=A0A139A1T4_GONPJ|nr:hypothetical protein M427DRAFT_61959 [Gonapodya prolifera JEL478]|eukprot:KXS10598.1 hypothetical protein M427DRAFT_61959 [Gonapodya prolifera JEL478]
MPRSEKPWLEVAVNGSWTRKVQPGRPITVDEIVRESVECAKLGASVSRVPPCSRLRSSPPTPLLSPLCAELIIHMHAYDAAWGVQKDDPDLYAAIFRGIISQVDCICYPTVPTGARRFEAVQDLARRGALEWCTLDPGSCNYERNLRQMVAEERLWNEDHIKDAYKMCFDHRIHPSFAIYEPGLLRAGSVWQAHHPQAPIPIYRFMLSSRYLWSFPPKPYALHAYTSLLADEAPGMPWMVAGLDVDVTPLVEETVNAGGHVRVGLEDAPMGTKMSNVEWTKVAVEKIQNAGKKLATAKEVRADLKEMEMEYRSRKGARI